jgi:hypothetical protein
MDSITQTVGRLVTIHQILQNLAPRLCFVLKTFFLQGVRNRDSCWNSELEKEKIARAQQATYRHDDERPPLRPSKCQNWVTRYSTYSREKQVQLI